MIGDIKKLFLFFQMAIQTLVRPNLSPSMLTMRLVVGIISLNLFVLAWTAFFRYQSWQRYEERTSVAVQNVAQLLEHDISAVFDRVDLTLLSAVDEVEAQIEEGKIDSVKLNEFLKRRQDSLPEAIGVRVTDAQGMVRYGLGSQSGVLVNASEREHFVRQRERPDAGLVIAQPVMARIGKDWVVPISRRINRPDGSFAGIVYASIPVKHFHDMFASLDLGAHGVVALRNLAHVALARFPVVETGHAAVGQSVVTDTLRNAIGSNVGHGLYKAVSPSDKLERTLAFRRLGRYPLYVVVGLAGTDYLSGWWLEVFQGALLLLLFAIVSALLAVMLFTSWRRQWLAGEALRRSEELWSFALEGGGYCVWDWDLPTGRVTLSMRGKQLFGFADDEIGDDIKEWEERIHPDDKPRLLQNLRSHLRGQAVVEAAEYRVRGKDDQWKWILTRGMVVNRDARGRVLRMIGTHVDISERREREEALNLAATVFDIADEGVLVTNAQNKIISVNPSFTAITGYAPDDVLGRDPSMLSAKTQPKAFYQELWASLARSGSWRGEVVNRRKSGEVYIEWLSIKRLADAHGQLTHYVAVFSDITARKEAETRMQHLALHDALTDLPNRALLAERLTQAIVRARRDKVRLGLLYFDLDKFKPVNDSYGHDVGDALLQAVARRVGDCVRAADTVARIGGDEFVVLLSAVQDAADALAVAEKIREALARPFEVAGHSFGISSSIGVAIYPEHGGDEGSLTRHADAAMYQAKRGGSNQVLLYQPGM